MKVGQINAVCFDIDDTLVDYATSSRVALAEVVGHDDAWPTWQRTTERHLARLISGEVDYETMRRERTRAFFADLGEFLDDTEVVERERRRTAVMERASQLFDDALPCLEWLRAAGLKLAAVTNASGPHQRVKLAMLGLVEFFDHVVIAGELGAAKPDPMIFHTACVALGVPPAEAVHVGDRLDLDALGARDAGLYGVWLNRAENHCVDLPKGVTAISSLDELPELLACDLSDVRILAARARYRVELVS